MQGLSAQRPNRLATDTIAPGVGPRALRDSAVVDLSKIKISNEGLDDEVDYGSRDSMWFDVINKQLHLYGNAFVKYTSIDLKAGYILLDYAKNEVLAEQLPDTSGQLSGLPEFKDGEQAFSATRLRYNFKTKKGIIYEARTKQDELYVLGQRAKFVSNPDTTSKVKNTIYNEDAIITTCDAPHPHFGIHTRKLKVIPDKLVVTGFSNIEIGGIPTPLVLPFGFYPITKSRKAGMILPTDFEFADREGLGVKDWGWYQPISDHLDVTARCSLYVSGTWGVRFDARYNQLYKYNGNFQMRFNNRVTENEQAQKVSAKSFGITWSHNQDPKAHPTRKFGGSVNIETNRDNNRNRNDYNSVYRNTMNSNLTYSQLFPGRPFQFNAGLTHSQNTQTRQMNITLPTATFTMQRIFPFKRKKPVGSERWYEKISLNYSSQLQNSFQTVDTLLFTRQTLRNARMGIQHRASSDFNVKIFKYINIAPRVNYEENWYPYAIRKDLIDSVIYRYDTVVSDGITYINIDSSKTVWGIDTTYRDWGFNSFRKYDVGISANTALFMTKQFKRGWLRGIRHTVKPSVSLGFGPDYTGSRYFKEVSTDLRPDVDRKLRYSILDEAIFSRPTEGDRSVALNYSIGNVLEFKHFSAKRDTVLKKRIFDNLVFSGNYSLTADSLKWSTVSTSGLFRLFKGITNLTWNLTMDPYVLNEKGVRVDKYVLKEEGKLLRVSRFGVQFNTNFTVARLRDVFLKKDDRSAGSSTQQRPQPTTGGVFEDGFINWLEEFNFSHNIAFERRSVTGTNRDTFLVSVNNFSMNGRIPLTSKWSVNIDNISYDFQSKSLVYPSLGFSRDLHCWELSMSWQPTRGVYTFFIGVKPGMLDFLKVPYRKNNFDGRAVF